MEKNIKIKLLILAILFMILLSGFIRAVEPKKICKDMYYSVIKVGYDYDKISQLNYSQEDIDDYYFNHYELCVLQNHTKSFPERTYEEIVINKKELCELKEFFFDYTIQIPDFEFENLSCKNAKLLNYFLKMEETNSYSATKIRIWWGILLIFGFLFISAIRQNSWLKKLIERYSDEQ